MDYGLRVKIHPTAFLNRNCVLLDVPVADLTIGAHVKIAPNVTIACVGHPINPDERRSPDPSVGRAVTIEDDVWIAAGATIMPGVTVGKGAFVGAMAMVNRNVEPYTAVGGNPAKPFLTGLNEDRFRVLEPSTYVTTLEDALAHA
ncbi:Uu.00g117120.m01.CDS01 [Anthostomella pinea]|uniref:Uu.00g117120.m01.CDS01 n=1 Tax=Anthostomella pinea TaxID=933095 RepID=A0AAI8YEH2_9PEZI|nr:Uu.00g117120.m01.CDS01 [Anthostomella pinea]